MEHAIKIIGKIILAILNNPTEAATAASIITAGIVRFLHWLPAHMGKGKLRDEILEKNQSGQTDELIAQTVDLSLKKVKIVLEKEAVKQEVAAAKKVG